MQIVEKNVANHFLCTLHNSLNWLYVILRLFVGNIFAVAANWGKTYLLNRFEIAADAAAVRTKVKTN